VAKKTVAFSAHQKVKKPVEVEFKTKDGEKVDFIARKPMDVPIRVKFTAKVKKK
jgi:hypothetical protein